MKKSNTKKKCAEEEIELCEEEMQKLKDALLGEEDCEEDYLDMILYRDIILDGEIDDTVLRKVTMKIIYLNKLDDMEEIEPCDRLPIKIYISSYGGDVQIGNNLIDIIKASETPIETITMDKAFSMGCLIALAGHKRYCYSNSCFLIHDGFLNIQNSGSKARDMFQFYIIKGEEKIRNYILEHTKISKKLLEKNWNNEWYIDSGEALSLGLVDEIIDYIK